MFLHCKQNFSLQIWQDLLDGQSPSNPIFTLGCFIEAWGFYVVQLSRIFEDYWREFSDSKKGHVEYIFSTIFPPHNLFEIGNM